MWGRVNHNHLFVLDRGDGQTAFIRTVRTQAEDTANALETGVLCQGRPGQRVGFALADQRADGRDAVIGQPADRMRCFAIGRVIALAIGLRLGRVRQGKPTALNTRQFQRLRPECPSGSGR